jgi:hypothetical protein
MSSSGPQKTLLRGANRNAQQANNQNSHTPPREHMFRYAEYLLMCAATTDILHLWAYESSKSCSI